MKTTKLEEEKLKFMLQLVPVELESNTYLATLSISIFLGNLLHLSIDFCRLGLAKNLSIFNKFQKLHLKNRSQLQQPELYKRTKIVVAIKVKN